MKFDNVIFDFDGTLADTSKGVIDSVKYALSRLGVAIPGESVLRGFIGPSLYSSFTGIIGFDDETAKEAIRLYRSVYEPHGVFECELYDGMKDLLVSLKKEGVSLSVASAKPQNALDIVVDFLDIRQYFDKVAGADPSVKDNDKALLVAAAKTRENAVMVGDSVYDVDAAKLVGIKCAAVGFGFTGKETLLAHSPDFYAASVADLGKILK